MNLTFCELVEGFTILLERHPELADKEVTHASECGYSVSGFEKPLCLAVPIMTEEFADEGNYIRICSDDDGYRTNRAIKDWKFIYLR